MSFSFLLCSTSYILETLIHILFILIIELLPLVSRYSLTLHFSRCKTCHYSRLYIWTVSSPSSPHTFFTTKINEPTRFKSSQINLLIGWFNPLQKKCKGKLDHPNCLDWQKHWANLFKILQPTPSNARKTISTPHSSIAHASTTRPRILLLVKMTLKYKIKEIKLVQLKSLKYSIQSMFG